MVKRIFCIFFVIFSVFCLFSVPALAYTPSDFEVTSEYACMASLDNGTVIYSKNPDERVTMAALTNIMTAVLICENIDDLENTVMTVPDEAVTSLLGTGAAIANLKIGEEITANDILHAIILNSAPDCAITAAVHIAGSVGGFVELMNKKAEALKLTETHFANVTGLDGTDHYTTASDMCRLARHAYNITDIREASRLKRYTIPKTNKSNERILSTTNYLVDIATNYYYKYANGLKTGYTSESGRCVVATATYEGYTYVCVLMKAPNKTGNRAEFVDARNLFKWAFTQFEFKAVADKNEMIGEAGVELAWDIDHIPLYPENDLTALVPKGADISTITVKYDFDINKKLEAPIKKGQKIGSAELFFAGESLGKINVVSGDSVSRNAFLGFAKLIKDIVRSTFFKIILAAIIIAAAIFILSIVRLNSKKHKSKGVHRW